MTIVSTGGLIADVEVTYIQPQYGDFFAALGGNVVTKFNADDTGVSETSAELLAAFDSDHAIYIPPGEYKYGATFSNTTKPKLVWCFGEKWVQTDVEISSRKNFKRLGEQSRFIASANVDAVNVKSLMSWVGGNFDSKNVLPPNCNKAAFNVDMDWLGGQYGGRFWNFATQGEASQIGVDDVSGWHGVVVNFANQTVNGARFEGWRCEVEQVKAQDGWRVSAYNPGYNQHSGLHTVDVNYSESYRAYYDSASSHSWFSNLMQTQSNIFNDPALALTTYTAVVLGPYNVGMDYGVQDFAKAATCSHVAIHFGPHNKLELTNAGDSPETNFPIFEQPQLVEQLANDIVMVLGNIT